MRSILEGSKVVDLIRIKEGEGRRGFQSGNRVDDEKTRSFWEIEPNLGTN